MAIAVASVWLRALTVTAPLVPVTVRAPEIRAMFLVRTTFTPIAAATPTFSPLLSLPVLSVVSLLPLSRPPDFVPPPVSAPLVADGSDPTPRLLVFGLLPLTCLFDVLSASSPDESAPDVLACASTAVLVVDSAMIVTDVPERSRATSAMVSQSMSRLIETSAPTALSPDAFASAVVFDASAVCVARIVTAPEAVRPGPLTVPRRASA